MLFDRSSIIGSFSQVSSIELNVREGLDVGHPQVLQPQLGQESQHGVVDGQTTFVGYESHGGVTLGVGVGVGVGTVIPEQI
jgi:hypothetical protein